MNDRQILVPGDKVRYNIAVEVDDQTEASQISTASSATCSQSAFWRFRNSRAVVIAVGDVHENHLDSEYCIEMKVFSPILVD
jgi:hypothetical protein